MTSKWPIYVLNLLGVIMLMIGITRFLITPQTANETVLQTVETFSTNVTQIIYVMGYRTNNGLEVVITNLTYGCPIVDAQCPNRTYSESLLLCREIFYDDDDPYYHYRSLWNYYAVAIWSTLIAVTCFLSAMTYYR